MKIFGLIILISFSVLQLAFAQVENLKQDYRLEIKYSDEKLMIDGKLDEPLWQSLNIATNFWKKSPFVEKDANPITEVKMSYDDKFLYIGAKCHQKKERIIQSLKRDEFWDSDGFAILLDPLNTKANAYLFGVSAAGVQWDALRSLTSGINSDWSNKWYAEIDVQDDYWSAEIAIPFQILRYDNQLTEWGLNFIRNATFVNEFHNWTQVPNEFWPVDPTFAGTLVWDKSPSKQTSNYNIIPYVSTSVDLSSGSVPKATFSAGADAKIGITSALNLDLTVNPDFSQIEADELVTNLTRFNINLPEKRTFFLENSDIFADYGYTQIRPFVSRNIGLDENRQTVPITYGARLSGNFNKNLRVGAMNIHSAGKDDSNGQNFSALALSQRFGRSYIQGMFLNRQAFDGAKSIKGDFGRNLSLEAAYLSQDGSVATWTGFHQSYKKGITKENNFLNIGFSYQNTNWEFLFNNVLLDKDYYADMGFIARIENYDAIQDTTIRMGLKENYLGINYRIRPEKGNIGQHRISFENYLVLNPDWTFNEQFRSIGYFLSLKSGEEFRLQYEMNSIDLLFPFTFTESEPLPKAKYKYNAINFRFQSDDRKKFSYNLSGKTGGFYNGQLNQITFNANYRVQPWANFGIGGEWNDLRFPDIYGNRTITAIVSKIEIGFSRNLLWTSLFQYVDQSNYMGINSRLQWRFAPMSDLFFVYVDNYDVIEFDRRRRLFNDNRALIFKLNYWY